MRKICLVTFLLLFESCLTQKVSRKDSGYSDDVYFDKNIPSSVANIKKTDKILSSVVVNPAQLDNIGVSRKINEKESVELVEQVVSRAKEYLGCKYQSGGKGPKRFDCSGFTSFIYGQFGVSLAASSAGQASNGIIIDDRKDLRQGDLVLFNGHSLGERIGHVGIVTEVDNKTGEFYFIHSAISGGVRIDHSSQDYYRIRYKTARRIF